MTRRRAAAVRLTALALAAALAGCSSADQPRPDTAVAPVLTATSDPILSPVTAGAPDSAEATVADLLTLARRGRYGGIAALYEPRARATVGARRIAAIYSLERHAFDGTAPAVVGARPIGRVVQVRVRTAQPEGAPTEDRYLMRQGADGWRVAFDTFLLRGSSSLAALTVDGQYPDRATPGGRRAARTAARRVQNLEPATS